MTHLQFVWQSMQTFTSDDSKIVDSSPKHTGVKGASKNLVSTMGEFYTIVITEFSISSNSL